MESWQDHAPRDRHWRLEKVLKGAFAVKLVVLASVWAAMDRGLHFGDLSLSAASGTGDTEGEKPQASAENPANSDAKDAPNAALAAASSPTKGDSQPKTRQSFLSKLLDLPPLDPKAIQKDELGKYLEMAERKKRQVEDRLELLKRREDQLKKLEGSIDGKLRQLDEERRFFAQTMQQEKDLKGERLERLTELYGKMEPKKAAPVFESLDKDLIVELFKKLPQKQVTAILENLSPARSVAMSEYYGRVRSAREYEVLKEMNASLRKEFDECKGMPANAPKDN